MKIAVSNIAWESHENTAVLALMKEYKISGIEIAPTKIHPEIETIDDQPLDQYRRFWEDAGIEVVATQSVLFGHSEMKIFGDDYTRQQTLNHLNRMAEISSKLGAKVMVFGSPKNRAVGALPLTEQATISSRFFQTVAQNCQRQQVVFGLEPNATEYGADFVTDTTQGVQLVRSIDHPNFRLHLDAGVMTLNHEAPLPTLKLAAPYLCHFHISEPNLSPVGTTEVNHQGIAQALREIEYPNWVSIEMRGMPDHRLDHLRLAFATAQKYYGQA